jgi:hypothetical protein
LIFVLFFCDDSSNIEVNKLLINILEMYSQLDIDILIDGCEFAVVFRFLLVTHWITTSTIWELPSFCYVIYVCICFLSKTKVKKIYLKFLQTNKIYSKQIFLTRNCLQSGNKSQTVFLYLFLLLLLFTRTNYRMELNQKRKKITFTLSLSRSCCSNVGPLVSSKSSEKPTRYLKL